MTRHKKVLNLVGVTRESSRGTQLHSKPDKTLVRRIFGTSVVYPRPTGQTCHVKFCSECGSHLQGKAKFCPECGTSVSQGAIAKSATPKNTKNCTCDDQTYNWTNTSGIVICSECGKAIKGKRVNCQHDVQIRDGRTYCDKCHYFLQAPDPIELQSDSGKKKDSIRAALAIAKFASAIFVVIAAVAIYNSFHPSAPTPPESSSNNIYLTQDALDGQFKFQVTAEPKCGISKVGDAYINAVAKGQFCSIRLWVTNKSDKPATFFDANQKLYDATGNEYSASTEADSAAHGGIIYSSINPGLKIFGDVYFDLPSGAVPDHAVLHDSAFSDGVTVLLRNDPALTPIADSPSPVANFPSGYTALDKEKTWGWKWGDNPSSCPTGNVCGSGSFLYSGVCAKGFTIKFLEYSEPKSNNIIGSGSETWQLPVTPGEPVHINFKLRTPEILLKKYPNLASGPNEFTCSN